MTKWSIAEPLQNHCKTATLTLALAASPKSLGVENPEKVVTACTAGTVVLLLIVLEVLEADAGGDGEASSGEGEFSSGEGEFSSGEGEPSSGEGEASSGEGEPEPSSGDVEVSVGENRVLELPVLG